MASNQREDLFGVRAISCVHYHVQADTSERSVGTETMDPYVKDVDVLRGKDPGELMQKAGLVVEPGAEGEIATG
jgi:hypothetical protein